jgi:ubiquinone/menaquinone biosynthesis C-methylase UbiE
MRNVESYYDEKSKDYDTTFDTLYFKISDAVTWRYLEPYLPLGVNDRVLDAAGGTGRWAVRMAKRGCRVTLLDISERMLDAARRKVKREGLGNLVSIEKGDIRKLHFRDGAFDMILCEHALFLFEDPGEVLGEFSRVLKKGARLVVSAPNRYVHCICQLPCTGHPSPEKLEEVLDVFTLRKFGLISKDNELNVYTWTPGEFRALLEENGFQLERMIGKGVTMPLRIANEVTMARDYDEGIFSRLLKLELEICYRPDSLALAGHLQAIAKNA